MASQTIADALVLGILEGLTEFIPVSSTGHLLLARHFLGFESTGKAFVVLIQLGAILAVVAGYFARLWKILLDLPHDPRARRFVIGVLVAFLPAAIIGALAHDFIEGVLFETPKLICIMLILGGLVLFWVDRWALTPKYHDIMDLPLPVCLGIGLFQCLALIPGTSRSGATIVGAMLLGADKRSSAEFSFFLAMPVMFGAFVFDLLKNRDILSVADLPVIATGFIAAFVVAIFVVRYLVDYVSRHGFVVFAWWRVIVGVLGLAALFAWG
jgi:undecaprenyl-diphosphatase